MAILETDGQTVSAFGPAGERRLDEGLRALLVRTISEALNWPRGQAEPEIFSQAAEAVAREHFTAGSEFLKNNGLAWRDLDLIGMHGQTVLHERPQMGQPGRTLQLGNGEWLARATGVPVAFDFRSADVLAGGEGAPLAPIYHLARARHSGLEAPLAILNIGGVANLTAWSGGDDVVAFDTGPGNGLIDQWVHARSGLRFDEGGRFAAQGRVDDARLQVLLNHAYFRAPAPKSLDRYDFAISDLEGLSLEDGAATLVAFTIEAIKRGLDLTGSRPGSLIVSGGGRHNPEIMRALHEGLPVKVQSAEAHGWRGDALEAEAFAFLAARTWHGLPISFPGTTGVRTPSTGGRIAQP